MESSHAIAPANRYTGLTGGRIVIPSDVACLDEAREPFSAFLGGLGLGELARRDWLLVFTEALVNAVRHAHKPSPAGNPTVAVTWVAGEDFIQLEITDTGQGPDCGEATQPGLPEDDTACSGRGLYLIRHFCDRWEHWRSEGGYRQVLVKYYPSGLPGGAEPGWVDQAMAELSLCYESLAAFYRLGEALIQAESVTAFIGRALGDLARVVPHDGLIIIFEDDLQSALRAEIAINPWASAPPSPPDPRYVAVKESGVEYVWEKPEDRPRFLAGRASSAGVLCPVKAAGRVIAVLVVLRSPQGNSFNAAALNTVRTFADLFGIALAHADNALVRGREQRALRDLEIASTLQETLLPLPRDSGQISGGHFIARRSSAREVAGDYIDVSVSPQGDVLLVVVDVMGKGVSAALLAAMFRTALGIHREFVPDPLLLLETVNRVLCRQIGEATLFATCCMAMIPHGANKVIWVNAGHCPGLHLNRDGRCVAVEPSGPPLGLFMDAEYRSVSQPLSEGDRLCLFSDGVYEWETPEGLWGWDNWLALVKETLPQAPARLWDKLSTLQEELAPVGVTPQDDCTLLVWQTTDPAAKTGNPPSLS